MFFGALLICTDGFDGSLVHSFGAHEFPVLFKLFLAQ